MKLIHVLVASVSILNLPLIAMTEAQAAPGDLTRTAPAPKPRSTLLAADCKETAIMPAALPARPTQRRATIASHPTHHARKAHKPRKPVHRKHAAAKHRAKHRGPHAARHPARASLRLRRVTYASPLCGERSSAMNIMLGLPDYTVTQPPEAAVAPAIEDTLFDLPPVLGATGGGGGIGGPTFPIVIFPGWPVFPIGPGPVILPPVGPVAPPVSPGAVPEPATWATMIVGMALVGRSMRRRSRKAKKA